MKKEKIQKLQNRIKAANLNTKAGQLFYIKAMADLNKENADIKNFDDFTVEELKQFIKEGRLTNQEIVEFYCNQWWDETP